MCLKNLIIDKFRHQQSANKHLQTVYHLRNQHSNCTQEYIEYKDLQQSLQNQIQQLPGKMREVFVLNKMKHFSIDEISEKLNISKQTVKNQIVSAVSRLKTSLNYHYLILLFLFFLK